MKRFLSALSLATFVSPVVFATETLPLTDRTLSSTPFFVTSTKPAVDGVNGKLDVFGGAGQSNALSIASMNGLSPYVTNPSSNWSGIGGAIGTITVPIGHQFGAQIDLGSGAFGNRANGSAAGHLFWRDPEQGLVGVYGSGLYSTRGNGRTIWNAAGEFEKYIGSWTGRALLGIQGFGFNTSYSPFYGMPSNFSQPDRFFDKVSLTYYPNPDLALTIGHIYSKQTNGINGEVEYILPQYRGGEIAPAAYLTATYGWNNASVVMAGLKVYFGNHDKSLIRRHREDDPINHSALSNSGANSSSSYHGLLPSCSIVPMYTWIPCYP